MVTTSDYVLSSSVGENSFFFLVWLYIAKTCFLRNFGVFCPHPDCNCAGATIKLQYLLDIIPLHFAKSDFPYLIFYVFTYFDLPLLLAETLCLTFFLIYIMNEDHFPYSDQSLTQNSFFQNFFQIFLKFYSKFVSSFLRISFRIYLKSLKYFLKIFATFISDNFSEICTNFSKNFLKKLVKISIKFYSRIAQILRIVYRKFSPFCRLSTNFHYNFITS